MMRRKTKVLVVDDDPWARELVVDHLETAGFDVSSAAEGRSGLHSAVTAFPDVCILDVDLPGIDGFSILSAMRTAGSAAGVIMLTGMDSERDRIRGLRLGADDYLGKPFSPGELVARVEALVRRRGRYSEVLRYGPLAIDVEARRVTCEGSPVTLTKLEFDLLATLATAPRAVFTRQALLSSVWGYPLGWEGGDATLTELVHRLRTKLPRVPITTVRGVGYRFDG